ncbi:endonuclease MutS2 [Geobacter sulfurreducens]|uniref:Endonuclease MutS2 n=1 Tax=Geobacter sulfurreducens (strain ATCC 51573 / DSM 12127 / PCA) TaxID=243231 RepID=Q74FQ9_GEOSL|nr:endonuclease MutS2 [Geobacter sulfurreducens]AAR33878.1 DNA mismatch repair ATPase MutS-2 [Geobacter sulfurreducens PCA]AJY70298.1 DNA mismatch repair protein MutS [Geobacter sulfurreducens]UAC04623.1 endonuclease MutS2 [Geobacter sulfurreducens]HCD96095.1 endonuclease MutS2 [Geobacter sulfurreducens]
MIRTETLRTLEFDKILSAVSGYAHSGATRDETALIRPLDDREAIVRRFGQVDEIRRLRQLGIDLSLRSFEDIAPLLAAVRPDGAVLDPTELVVLFPILRTMTAIAKQFAYRTDIPLLRELAGTLTGFPDLLDELEVSIDSEGEILDSASPLLSDLRQKKRHLTERIRRRLAEIVRETGVTTFLQDDFITQRGGRWVIPVRMDSKGMVPGVVHDVSNSGETAFMEPLEIIGLANELENLVAEEKAEMIRIVRTICRMIRQEADGLDEQFRILVRLDVLNGIALFADSLGAETPEITDARFIRVREGRHPLLALMARERGVGRVVPLDLGLGGAERPDSHVANQVMVITGPNAGGKTISLKTTGLLHLMALAGIPVPAASTSSFPLISDLLVDIGDEQSIEQSLSTFSAHVSNIAGILERADRRTVVLLDELGTGTEPVQGAAISCAVLADLQDKGALVIATTHLTDIVGFVHKRDGMVNASMEFDRQTLTPLYRLTVGEPGQSHALEIARRYGLPDRVVAVATGMLSRMETEFHELLAELKDQRRRHEEALAEAERLRRDAEEKARIARERLAEAETRRREATEKALQEAKEIVRAARRDVNAIIEEARREKSREARKKIDEAEAAVEAKLQEFHPEETLSLDAVREGDTVFVKAIGHDGTVTAVDRRTGRLRVRAGAMELEVAATDVSPRRGKATEAKIRTGSGRRPAPDAETPREINLIGLRVDDALARLEPFLNHASLEGYGELRIVHGKGTGALMRAVREYLDGHPLVREFRPGEPFEGGEGATVVTLR